MKKFILSVFFLTCLSAVFAQVSVDPTDVFYQEAQGWELKGYVSSLPLIRPYPNKLIKEILEKVIDCGNRHDSEIALYEYERIFGKKLNLYVNGSGQYKNSSTLKDENGHEKSSKNFKRINGEGGVAGEFSLHPLVSLGYDLAIFLETDKFEKTSPYYVNKPEDSVFDPAKIGPVNEYLDWNMNISAGTTATYFTCGLNKTGYGPFHNDGLALNDTGYHSANIIFNVSREMWSYASTYQILGAKANNPDAFESVLSDGKYLAFHVIKYNFNKKLSVSYYENIIFGPRPNLAYLFPVPYMPVQNIGGASDNLQMGLMLEVKPVKGVVWATDIFVDDLSVNNVFKLNFDSKNRCAGQTGLIITPENNSCTYMALNYQLVIPYVYTHWEYKEGTNNIITGDSPNYQNYTNAAVNIGSTLDPNSDKVSFAATFQPKPNIKVDFFTNFIRHANSAEAFGIDDRGEYVLADKNQYISDGSASMHQMISDTKGNAGKHVNQAWDCLGFMTSDHKMGILQSGLKGQFDLPRTKHGQLSLFAGYTFEFVHNDGVRSSIYEGGNLNWTEKASDDGAYKIYILDKGLPSEKEFDGGSTESSWKMLCRSEEVQAEAKRQKQEWVNQLTDKVNNYFTVGFRYVY